MKRFSLIAWTFVLIFFLQINHVGLKSMGNPHRNFGACGETKNASTTEKCLCCALEQADTPSSVGIVPFPPSSGHKVSRSPTELLPSLKNQKIYPLPAESSIYKWKSTVVQNK
jgi:hypothetical protein